MYDSGRWLLLATLWSLQFIFMRVAVPVFGTAPVAEARALFATLFLVPWVVWFARQRIGPLEHWRDYLVIGLVNNVLPFLCFNFAATVLPAGYLAIINGLVTLRLGGQLEGPGTESFRAPLFYQHSIECSILVCRLSRSWVTVR